MTPASGTPVTLRSGAYEAHLATIGATLRALTHDGRHLVVPFAVDQMRPASRGRTLAPWVNRVIDGRYEFGGRSLQLPLTEPKRSNAIHGLVGWLDFEIVSTDADAATLAAEIVPQAGYPWWVRVEVTYRLDADGLTQTVVATNVGEDAAPYGAGSHPYLVAGPAPLDDWTFELAASQVLEVTDERLIPVGLTDVEGSERFDWSIPHVLGAVELDHAYTGLSRTAGVAVARVTDPSGVGVELTWGEDCPWVQVHTADLPGGPAQPGNRAGLAVEPMTSAPDAFNAGRYPYDTGLIVLEPGASATASWRIAAI